MMFFPLQYCSEDTFHKAVAAVAYPTSDENEYEPIEPTYSAATVYGEAYCISINYRRSVFRACLLYELDSFCDPPLRIARQCLHDSRVLNEHMDMHTRVSDLCTTSEVVSSADQQANRALQRLIDLLSLPLPGFNTVKRMRPSLTTSNTIIVIAIVFLSLTSHFIPLHSPQFVNRPQ